jgi:hypothetical protein
MDLADTQHYWRTQHGPLIRGLATGMRMVRYLQVHYCEDVDAGPLTAARDTIAPPYAGHAEAWFNHADLLNMTSLPEAARAMALAIEDEAKFIDFKRSCAVIGKERVFIDRR